MLFTKQYLSQFYKGKIIDSSLIKLNKEPISQRSIEIIPLWITLIKLHYRNKHTIDPREWRSWCKQIVHCSTVVGGTLQQAR